MMYGITNITCGFPENYLPDIKAINDTIAKIKGAPSRMLRYAPLKNSRYLLSVFGPEPVGNRSTWQIVHFLMNTDAAIAFFFQPFEDMARAVYDLTHRMLTSQLPARFEQPLDEFQPFSNISDCDGIYESKLLEAAIQENIAQMDCGADTPEKYLEKRLAFIPPHLRYKLRFMIDAPVGLNDADINIYIRKDAVPTPERTSYDYLSSIPAEIPLYRHLQFCIHNWNTFQELGLLVQKKDTTLNSVLKKFPADAIIRYIRSPIVPLSEAELSQLRDAAGRIFFFFKSPIYKATEAVLVARSKKGKASKRNVQKKAVPVAHPRKTDLSLHLYYFQIKTFNNFL